MIKGTDVTLRGLSKRFGKVWALKDLDLEVQAGELVAFLGPSGCGKTTTLLLIAGIYRPTTGEIHFGERRVDHLHPKDRDVGMVFQSYALYPHLTLFENIAFPLRLKKVPDAEVKSRVQSTADLLGIGHILDRRPAQVSGGQQQRAALARALVKEPQLLLLDEPLSNLDAQIRLSARAEIRRLQRDLGVTAILVTHDQAEALAMADRVAVFSTGELQQFATPDELYRKPKNTFVASFVGAPPMNLIEGVFKERAFEAGGFRQGLKGPHPQGQGWLGIRPEDIELRAEGTPATVLVVEPLGREALVMVESGGVRLQVLVPAEAKPAPDQQIHLHLPAEKLHYFDRTGTRVGP